jgi:dTMP kinase
VYSSLAYQGGARGLGIDRVREVNRAGLGDVWPDMVILLRLEPGEGLRRERGTDRIGGQGLEFQQSVADAYERLVVAEPIRVLPIDAARPVDAVADEVVAALGERWLF